MKTYQEFINESQFILSENDKTILLKTVINFWGGDFYNKYSKIDKNQAKK